MVDNMIEGTADTELFYKVELPVLYACHLSQKSCEIW